MIRVRACDALKARDVVEEMGCSRRLAELRFREMTGSSILEHIQMVRLEHAMHLLERTSDKLSRIAHACGYGSSESFRKFFFKEKGCSPSFWRKSLRKRFVK
jgi:AraC-like DNA-binding protein